jgi:hypothetical protein
MLIGPELPPTVGGIGGKAGSGPEGGVGTGVPGDVGGAEATGGQMTSTPRATTVDADPAERGPRTTLAGRVARNDAVNLSGSGGPGGSEDETRDAGFADPVTVPTRPTVDPTKGTGTPTMTGLSLLMAGAASGKVAAAIGFLRGAGARCVDNGAWGVTDGLAEPLGSKTARPTLAEVAGSAVEIVGGVAAPAALESIERRAKQTTMPPKQATARTSGRIELVR